MTNLAQIRKKKGLSIKILAEKVDVSQRHLFFIEQGKRFPSIELAIKLSTALDCSLDDLIDKK